MSMERCGFCVFLTDMMRRAMCLGDLNRRESTDSFYRELGNQETFKIEDRSSDGSTTTEEYINPEWLGMGPSTSFQIGTVHRCCHNHYPFLAMITQGKKRLLTQMLIGEPGLLDDMHYGQIQCALERIHLWKFNAFTLENVSGGRGLAELCSYLFQYYGLYSHFKLDVTAAWKLFTLIENGYHSTNPYHNSVHAIDVTQAMHCFLKQKAILKHCTPTEIMACLIAAISHDVDHPGVSQPFLISTSNHLAVLYKNTAVLENHHWRSAVSSIVESRILDNLKINRVELIHHINSLIMSTDVTRQDEYLAKFKIYLDTNTLDLSRREHRHLILQIAIKCADISNPCREWEISKMWSLKVCEEFFRQGDREREMNAVVTSLCDRYTNTVPKIQIGFSKYVVAPLITEWHRFLQNDLSAQMLKNLLYNQNKWEEWAAEEAADETDVSDMVDDDIDEANSSQNVLGNLELLPLRRSSFSPACQQLLSTDQQEQLELEADEHEQDDIPGIREQESETESTERSELLGERSKINDEQSEVVGERRELIGEFSDASEEIGARGKEIEPNPQNVGLVSRPFSVSDTQMTISASASNMITGDRDCLFRLQTFPPFDYAQNRLDEGAHITKTQKVADIHMIAVEGSSYGKNNNTIDSSCDSEHERANTSTEPVTVPASQQTDTPKIGEKKKPEETVTLTELLRRTFSPSRFARRGSAPVSTTENLAASTAQPPSRRRSLQNWFSRIVDRDPTPRRGSLPAEMLRNPDM